MQRVKYKRRERNGRLFKIFVSRDMQLHASSRLYDNDNARLLASLLVLAQEQRKGKKNTKGARFASWFLVPRCHGWCVITPGPDASSSLFDYQKKREITGGFRVSFCELLRSQDRFFLANRRLSQETKMLERDKRNNDKRNNHIDIFNIIFQYNGKDSLSFLLKFFCCSLEKIFDKLYRTFSLFSSSRKKCRINFIRSISK